MRELSLSLLFILALFFVGCGDAKSEASQHNSTKCPQCHMEVDKTNMYSSRVDVKDKHYVFDDIGCMVLYAQKYEIDFSVDISKVFTKDTKKFIPIYKARYKMHERTPMKYGFVAYEIKDDMMIEFDEVRLKMLRGEHMANPKIRKKVLGV